MGNISVRFTKRTHILTIHHVVEKMGLEWVKVLIATGQSTECIGPGNCSSHQRPLLTICSSLGTAASCIFQYTRKSFTSCPKGEMSIGLSRTCSYIDMACGMVCSGETELYFYTQDFHWGKKGGKYCWKNVL